MAFYDQSEFDIRCEWGMEGLKALAPVSDVVVIVDVLSFSTAVDVAVGQGAYVFPCRWKDESALDFARSVGAELADPNRNLDRWSLSPASLVSIPSGTRLVLPSPNGSNLSLTCGRLPTFAGSIRNAKAVAEATQSKGKRILIVAAGERWPDGTMRPAVEDWIGAGAIIHYVSGKRSPEAESARAAFLNAQDTLLEILQQCSSGRELIERGFGSDVDYASALNVSQIAPLLRDQCYSA